MNGKRGTPSILVTGGAGYIGSHFVALLESRNIPYVVVDDLSRGRCASVPQGKLYVGAIEDAALIANVCRSHNVDVAVHFAAFAYVEESVLQPALYYRNNVVHGIMLLEALRAANVRAMVFSSSCATYGIPAAHGAIRETDEQRPINPYGMSKLVFEQILRDYERAYDFRSIALRYFNAAGASALHPIYEAHDPETHLIPLAIKAAHEGLDLYVNGHDYETRDGTCERDYVHVDDLAAAHLAAVRSLRAGAASEQFNLGLGRGYTLLEVIAAVESVTGRRVNWHFGSRRIGDAPSLVTCNERAVNELQWTPRYDSIEGIVQTANVGYLRSIEAQHARRGRDLHPASYRPTRQAAGRRP
jgi:UDP-glucose-4-epimerase GalE